jgi:predicted ATPase
MQTISNIVFQKTSGNPFFDIFFFKSLVDKRKMLQYCPVKHRYVLDKDGISSLDITGNVLHLLTSKMNGLSGDVRTALKVAACFGIKMKSSMAQYLSATSQYSNIFNGLEESCQLGFMISVWGLGWGFSHDKIRKAAYSLIPDFEKDGVSASEVCLWLNLPRDC